MNTIYKIELIDQFNRSIVISQNKHLSLLYVHNYVHFYFETFSGLNLDIIMIIIIYFQLANGF